MEELTLYTTEGCHLCDQAEALCDQAAVNLHKVEIAHDAVLMARYGVRIPVLKHPQSERELGWPFDLPRLESWLRQC